jgi:broad specificity phosphatase PhoE
LKPRRRRNSSKRSWRSRSQRVDCSFDCSSAEARGFDRRAFDTLISLILSSLESIDDVAERLESFVEELRCLDLPAVAVVSHNFITKLLLCDLMGLGRDGFRQVGADLGSITTLGIDRGRVSLHQLNDTCHLRHLETSHHPG